MLFTSRCPDRRLAQRGRPRCWRPAWGNRNHDEDDRCDGAWPHGLGHCGAPSGNAKPGRGLEPHGRQGRAACRRWGRMGGDASGSVRRRRRRDRHHRLDSGGRGRRRRLGRSTRQSGFHQSGDRESASGSRLEGGGRGCRRAFLQRHAATLPGRDRPGRGVDTVRRRRGSLGAAGRCHQGAWRRGGQSWG